MALVSQLFLAEKNASKYKKQKNTFIYISNLDMYLPKMNTIFINKPEMLLNSEC